MQLDALLENMRRGGIKKMSKDVESQYPEVKFAQVNARAIKKKEWGPVCNWD